MAEVEPVEVDEAAEDARSRCSTRRLLAGMLLAGLFGSGAVLGVSYQVMADTEGGPRNGRTDTNLNDPEIQAHLVPELSGGVRDLGDRKVATAALAGCDVVTVRLTTTEVGEEEIRASGWLRDADVTLNTLEFGCIVDGETVGVVPLPVQPEDLTDIIQVVSVSGN